MRNICETQNQLDISAILIAVCCSCFKLFGVFTALFGVYANLDPFYLIVNQYSLEPLYSFTILTNILRFVISFISVTEGARILSVNGTIQTVFISIFNDIIASLVTLNSNCYKRKRIENNEMLLAISCEMLKRLNIIQNISKNYIGSVIASSLGIYAIVIIFSNFCTVELIYLIPLPIYMVFPVMAFSFPIALGVALSQAIQIHEKSKKLLYDLKVKANSMSNLGRKYHERNLKAIKELSICPGINEYELCIIKKSSNLTYFAAILNYTITAVISIPVHKMM